MKSTDQFSEIYLYRHPVDMRKYRNGLCAVVHTEMGVVSFGKALFIFANKKRDIIRFIYWDDTGFALWTKTLERQKYRWPKNMFKNASLVVSHLQLTNLLSGMDISSHKKLEFEKSF